MRQQGRTSPPPSPTAPTPTHWRNCRRPGCTSSASPPRATCRPSSRRRWTAARKRIQPTVLLSASPGQIAGTVTGGGDSARQAPPSPPPSTANPSAPAPRQPVTSAGSCSVSLPTPATYVLTVAAPGFGQTTVVVDLGPGEQPRRSRGGPRRGHRAAHRSYWWTPTGAGVGGATVAVGGMTNPPTTNTLTAGTVGAFSSPGCPPAAALTLTFTSPGSRRPPCRCSWARDRAADGDDERFPGPDRRQRHRARRRTDLPAPPSPPPTGKELAGHHVVRRSPGSAAGG